jgi:hypothetical protein
LDFSDPPDVGFAAGSGLTSVELREGAEVCFSTEDTVLSADPIFPFLTPRRPSWLDGEGLIVTPTGP